MLLHAGGMMHRKKTSSQETLDGITREKRAGLCISHQENVQCMGLYPDPCPHSPMKTPIFTMGK